MVRDLEEMILREGPDTVAAFIAEPVMGAGGVILPPKGYFAGIEALLARYDIRFIADEVICGFGRTGDWFGTDTFKLNPDSVSMAKALTSAYFPLGAISIEEDLYQAMLERIEEDRHFRPWLYLHGPSRCFCRRAQDDRDLSSATGSSTMCARWRRPSSPALPGSPIIRWSARCAASA